MKPRTVVTAGDFEGCARKLDVLAEPTRLAVLEILVAGPLHVQDLQAVLEIEQSRLSHHLRVLRDAGLVEVTVDGKHRLYSVSRACTRRGIDLGCCTLRLSRNEPKNI